MTRASEGSSGVDRLAQQLYEQAIGLPPEQRERFLREQCARDQVLRGRVESMLSASSAQTIAPEQDRPSHVPTPTLDPTTAGQGERLSAASEASAALSPTPPMAPPATPHQIGHYKLLEVIGEGGFGTVWVADQTWPVKRRVALKIIKAGMDSKAVIARFEQERQALAIMEHPNIAKVLDAGTAPDGRPYFVMEYVPGEPITTYCDRNRLPIQQRLELFIGICEAVQHAHHKGIIHRDIKPSNVLISVATGSGPIVKVIDFGVAKAVSHNLTDKTLFTEHGQILGTPEYMSPEQAEMGALDIDTRTDVYALGVLLYELLTGALPFEPHDLRSRGYNEIQRIIREVDPPRPSVRLRSLGKVSAEIAAKRQARLEELEGQLRKELEWIPLMAMRKDRGERYATPIALADDIRNHLAGRPLVAGPESATYRARKFIHRNKFAVAAVSAVALALLIGFIVSTVGFVQSARNARIARIERDRAEANLVRANEEAARQRAANLFTSTLLANANPAADERKDLRVIDVLETTVLQLDAGAQAGRPQIEAAIRASLGSAFRSLSLFKPAEIQYRRALELEVATTGSDSAETARILTGLALVQLDLGELAEAERGLQRALMIQRDVLPDDDVHLADTLNVMGMLADAQGDPKKAEARYREALSIYEQNPHESPGLPDAMTNLATILYGYGDRVEALKLAERALDIRRQRSGNRSVDVWNSLTNLASMQEGQDDLAAAERTRRDALTLARELVDRRHRMNVTSMSRLAWTLWLREGDALGEAERLQTEALDLAREIHGARSLAVAQGTQVLGVIARDRGDLDQAIELFRQELALRLTIQPADHPDLSGTLTLLADALTRAGQPQEAIPLAQRALEIRQKHFPAGHWALGNSTSVLGGARAGMGDFEQAEALLLEGFKSLDASTSALGKRARLDAVQRLIGLYEKWGKPDEAAKWRSTQKPMPNPATGPANAVSSDKL